ncbi:hypothetical protein BVRB_4g088280 [Beta vulgaris subsp. vulgaris]|nr:hypothetical protein BVRB_4g088280 [Beta vulgaris subsp. vulgaris]
MGNCVMHESQVEWGGEDWTPALMTDVEKLAMKMEEDGLASGKRGGCSTSKIKEVKVKVTKKQLEKWLGKMDKQRKSCCVEQALKQLMKVSVHCETHQRSWKPCLQSIPEY